MKIELPELLWHGKVERILSLDFNPLNNELVTAGTDSEAMGMREKDAEDISCDGHIKVWTVNF
jgi:hypothetical protein